MNNRPIPKNTRRVFSGIKVGYRAGRVIPDIQNVGFGFVGYWKNSGFGGNFLVRKFPYPSLVKTWRDLVLGGRCFFTCSQSIPKSHLSCLAQQVFTRTEKIPRLSYFSLLVWYWENSLIWHFKTIAFFRWLLYQNCILYRKECSPWYLCNTLKQNYNCRKW